MWSIVMALVIILSGMAITVLLAISRPSAQPNTIVRRNAEDDVSGEAPAPVRPLVARSRR
jgi:hypothetical protein